MSIPVDPQNRYGANTNSTGTAGTVPVNRAGTVPINPSAVPANPGPGAAPVAPDVKAGLDDAAGNP